MRNNSTTIILLLTLSLIFLMVFPFMSFNEDETQTQLIMNTTNPETDGKSPLSENVASEITPTPRDVARSFFIPIPNVPLPPVNEPIPVVSPVSADEWLQFLGNIRDEQNIERLYFKNKKTNTILKIRVDGTEEHNTRLIDTTAQYYQIEINKIAYRLSGGKK